MSEDEGDTFLESRTLIYGEEDFKEFTVSTVRFMYGEDRILDDSDTEVNDLDRYFVKAYKDTLPGVKGDYYLLHFLTAFKGVLYIDADNTKEGTVERLERVSKKISKKFNFRIEFTIDEIIEFFRRYNQDKANETEIRENIPEYAAATVKVSF